MNGVHDLELGRLFLRWYRTQGWGFRLQFDRRGFDWWLGRVMLEVHWLDDIDLEDVDQQ